MQRNNRRVAESLASATSQALKARQVCRKFKQLKDLLMIRDPAVVIKQGCEYSTQPAWRPPLRFRLLRRLDNTHAESRNSSDHRYILRITDMAGVTAGLT